MGAESMILFGFCICINDELYEAAAWGECVDQAFSFINEKYEWELMRCLDESAEWEWAEIAFYRDDPRLVYWMGEAEA